MNATEGREVILRHHQRVLSDKLAGVIVCGGLARGHWSEGKYSDVDFIVVVNETSGPTLTEVAQVRAAIAEELPNVSVSNTVVTKSEVEAFPSNLLLLDGKAVQSLLEAVNRPECFITSPESLPIPLPTDEQIQQFSAANFYKAQQLVRKVVCRADESLTPSERLTIAKNCLIGLKMELQYEQPSIFIDSVGSTDVIEVAHTADRRVLVNFLAAVKRNPEQVASPDVRDHVLNYFNEVKTTMDSRVARA